MEDVAERLTTADRTCKCNLKLALGFSNVAELQGASLFGGATAEQVEGRTGEEAVGVMRMGTILGSLVMKEGTRWGGAGLFFFFFNEKRQSEEAEVEDIGERRKGILTS